MILTFFNNYNNGDIHVSREFVKDIIKKTNATQITYHHKNSSRLLLDIPSVTTVNRPIIHLNKSFVTKTADSDNIPTYFINTWYNARSDNYKKYGCTLKTLYENFKIIYKELGISIESEEYYIPSIDFSVYQIKDIDNFVYNNSKKKKIFISNCVSLSGQSPELIPWDELIYNLSAKYPDYIFLITNPTIISRDNCIQTAQVIGGGLNNNLCENSYISTWCDVIIGNNSGAHTFSYVKENIMGTKKQRNIMISFYPEFTSQYNTQTKTIQPISNTFNLVNTISNVIK